MQCGCPQCGILMSKTENGVKSTCVCPECGYECSACLGTGGSLLTKEQVRAFAEAALVWEREGAEKEADDVFKSPLS